LQGRGRNSEGVWQLREEEQKREEVGEHILHSNNGFLEIERLFRKREAVGLTPEGSPTNSLSEKSDIGNQKRRRTLGKNIEADDKKKHPSKRGIHLP